MAEFRGLSVGVVAEAWILGLISAIVSFGFLVFNVRMRNTRMIKMSSPNLNVVIASGGLLLSGSCFLFGMDYFLEDDKYAASTMCQIRASTLVTASSLVFGPMFAKAWRIYRIFQQAAIKRVVIRDHKLFFITGVLLLCDVILVSVWQVVDPLEFRTTVLLTQILPDDAFNSSGVDVIKIQSCTSDNADAWVAGIFTFKTILLLYGLFLAWRTRNVMLPSMNDARSIIITSLTTVTMATFATSVGMLLRARPNAVYACFIFAIWLCNVVSMCVIFVPKVVLWWKKPDNASFRVSMSLGTQKASWQSFDQLEEELYHVVTENLSLKKSLQEKDAAIRDLQQHLNSAQEKLMQIGKEQEGRGDSGLDIDLSSSSGHEDDCDITTYGHLRPDHHCDTGYADDTQNDSLKTDCGQSYRRNRRASGHSAASVASLSRLCKLKDSICEDLSQAHTLSANLRNSLSKDLDKSKKRRSWMYDSVRSRQELAGAIARSYKLADNCDTYSYVSSYLPSASSIFNLDPSLKRHMQYSSAESLSTLANDRLYPEPSQQRRAIRKMLRQNSWKRSEQAAKKVYTIQNPQHPEFLQSAVAQTRALSGDTFV